MMQHWRLGLALSRVSSTLGVRAAAPHHCLQVQSFTDKVPEEGPPAKIHHAQNDIPDFSHEAKSPLDDAKEGVKEGSDATKQALKEVSSSAKGAMKDAKGGSSPEGPIAAARRAAAGAGGVAADAAKDSASAASEAIKAGTPDRLKGGHQWDIQGLKQEADESVQGGRPPPGIALE